MGLFHKRLDEIFAAYDETSKSLNPSEKKKQAEKARKLLVKHMIAMNTLMIDISLFTDAAKLYRSIEKGLMSYLERISEFESYSPTSKSIEHTLTQSIRNLQEMGERLRKYAIIISRDERLAE